MKQNLCFVCKIFKVASVEVKIFAQHDFVKKNMKPQSVKVVTTYHTQPL